jgi:hypothetical protein
MTDPDADGAPGGPMTGSLPAPRPGVAVINDLVEVVGVSANDRRLRDRPWVPACGHVGESLQRLDKLLANVVTRPGPTIVG